MNNKIHYKGEYFPYREINGLLFASIELEKAIIDLDDDVPYDDLAESIDEGISSYLSIDEFNTLSDEQVWAKYEGRPAQDIPDILDAIEDLTDDVLDEWFLSLSNPDKKMVMRNDPNNDWRRYSHQDKLMWYNTMELTKKVI